VTPRHARRSTALASFGWAIGIAALCGALVRHLAPPHHFDLTLIGNDVVASFGLAWAAVRMAVDRRNPPCLRAWSQAALAMLFLLAENHLQGMVGGPDATVLQALLSAALWIGAAYLCFACARRYAMRRYVMTVARVAVVVGLAATGLAFFMTGRMVSGAQGLLAEVQEAGELLSLALFVGALLLTQVAALKSYRFAPADLGRRARSLQYDFCLERRRKYPTIYRLFAYPGASHILIVAMILWCGRRAALHVARTGCRSVAGQILDMLRLGFGEGVDAKSYYVLDLYRQRPHGSADQTMTRVETKNGLNHAVQGLRQNSRLPREMGDKLAFWRICEEHGIPSAAILASVERGNFTRYAAREAFDHPLFVKMRRGRGGHGTMNFERIAPFTYRDDRGVVRDLLGVFDHVRAASASGDLIVQPKLANHPAIASLADRSLIVFRVVTCLDRRDEPQVTHGILRILRRFEPRWPSSPDSDWGCAIDLESGELGMMTGDMPATCTRWFADHPSTGERVLGRRLQGWGEIASAAAKAHRVFRGRILVGWDIGWTPEGVRILEGNTSPDVSYFQRVYRTPVGRSPLAPLLNFHLDALTERLLRNAAS
jgi:hypothetical protein